ncbi:hypothetical protein KHA80_01110 [Anaerobacillus sp. HL2]|nr:hypothetical protein KHA80_01110 [Anaerobacillus sp. HL2]
MSEDYRTRQGRRKKKDTKQKNTISKKSYLKGFLLLFSVFFFVLLIAGSLTVYSIIKDAPPLDPDKLTLSQNPEILDQNDLLFYNFGVFRNRRIATIDEIPLLLQNAFISVGRCSFS